MKKPSDDQIAMADQAGPASMVARKLGVHKRSVVSSRKLLREYRSWEAQSARDAGLPLAERRVEFMPLSRRTINILRRAGIESGVQLLSLSRQDLAKMRSVGEVVVADIDALLTREGVPKKVAACDGEKAPPPFQQGVGARRGRSEHERHHAAGITL